MYKILKDHGIAATAGAAAGLTVAASSITISIFQHPNTPIKALGLISAAFALGFIGFAKQLGDFYGSQSKKDSQGLKSLTKLLVFGTGARFAHQTLINGLVKARSPLSNNIFGPVMLGGVVLGTIFYLFKNNENPQDAIQRLLSTSEQHKEKLKETLEQQRDISSKQSDVISKKNDILTQENQALRNKNDSLQVELSTLKASITPHNPPQQNSGGPYTAI
jgi:hypothetical protein